MITRERLRGLLFLTSLAAIAAWLAWNLSANLAARGISIDFSFLGQATSFPIGESVIPFHSGDSYLRAFAVGLLNTIRLSVAGIVLATIFGLAIGLASRLGHPLLTRLAKAYVEFTRNVPLLLILVVCATLVRALPAPREAWTLPLGGLFSARGLYLPLPVFKNGMVLALVTLGLLLGLWLLRRAALSSKFATGTVSAQVQKAFTLWLAVLASLVLWILATTTLDRPELKGFNFRGGFSLTPEYIAMLFGLAFYTSGFIAEIVRGSLAALPKGQNEAAASLGLSPFKTLRLVLMPQALRLMLPPLANQYLNLIKNSTLAVLIGYPDLVSVGNTALNQTGRAIETVTIYLLIYLALSLVISVLIRRLERRAQLVKS